MFDFVEVCHWCFRSSIPSMLHDEVDEARPAERATDRFSCNRIFAISVQIIDFVKLSDLILLPSV